MAEGSAELGPISLSLTTYVLIMSAGLSGMAEGSAEFFYRAHFRAQRNFSCIFRGVSGVYAAENR